MMKFAIPALFAVSFIGLLAGVALVGSSTDGITDQVLDLQQHVIDVQRQIIDANKSTIASQDKTIAELRKQVDLLRPGINPTHPLQGDIWKDASGHLHTVGPSGADITLGYSITLDADGNLKKAP